MATGSQGHNNNHANALSSPRTSSFPFECRARARLKILIFSTLFSIVWYWFCPYWHIFVQQIMHTLQKLHGNVIMSPPRLIRRSHLHKIPSLVRGEAVRDTISFSDVVLLLHHPSSFHCQSKHTRNAPGNMDARSSNFLPTNSIFYIFSIMLEGRMLHCGELNPARHDGWFAPCFLPLHSRHLLFPRQTPFAFSCIRSTGILVSQTNVGKEAHAGKWIPELPIGCMHYPCPHCTVLFVGGSSHMRNILSRMDS